MQSDTYHQLLLNEKASVVTSLGFKPDALAGGGRLGEEDQAQVSNDESVQLHLNNLEYQKLRLLNAALDRLSTGDYGVCIRCDQAIPARRLQVLPWAKFCVPCQEYVTLHEAEDEFDAASSANFDEVH